MAFRSWGAVEKEFGNGEENNGRGIYFLNEEMQISGVTNVAVLGYSESGLYCEAVKIPQALYPTSEMN